MLGAFFMEIHEIPMKYLVKIRQNKVVSTYTFTDRDGTIFADDKCTHLSSIYLTHGGGLSAQEIEKFSVFRGSKVLNIERIK